MKSVGDQRDGDGNTDSIDSSWFKLRPSIPLPKSKCLVEGREVKISDFVTITKGKFQGQTGIVSSIEDDYVVLISLETCTRLKVFFHDLQPKASEESRDFFWGDLVQFEEFNVENQVGIVTSASKNTVYILTSRNQPLEKPAATLKKLARESNPSYIPEDLKDEFVRVKNGEFAGLEGKLKHVHQNFAFVFVKTSHFNGGFFVCDVANLEGYSCQKKVENVKKKEKKMEVAGKKSHPKVGQNVMISYGTYLGYIGLIKEMLTERQFRVQLLTINKMMVSSMSKVIDLCVSFGESF